MEEHKWHMKNIHKLQDLQPHVFNHVWCRGVIAKPGSVHLIYWKGGGRAHPQQYRTPILHEILNDQWKPTGSPIASTTPVSFHHTPPQWHNLLPAWVEQTHHTITNLSHPDSPQSCLQFHLWPEGRGNGQSSCLAGIYPSPLMWHWQQAESHAQLCMYSCHALLISNASPKLLPYSWSSLYTCDIVFLYWQDRGLQLIWFSQNSSQKKIGPIDCLSFKNPAPHTLAFMHRYNN